jgi:hypothetical protein
MSDEGKFGGQTADAAHDENSVIVTKKHGHEFLALRAAVEDAIVSWGQPQVITQRHKRPSWTS